MGNTLKAIENTTSNVSNAAGIGTGFGHDVGNNPIRSTIGGAIVGGLFGAGIAAGGAAALCTAVATTGLAILTGPIGLGLVAGVVIGGLLLGGIAWFMSDKKYKDFRQALNDEKLSPLFDQMEEIKNMAPESRGPALAELNRLSMEHREISDLYQMFQIALDADFRCAKCHSHLELIQTCLCHTKKHPQNVSSWTCHCLNKSHSCCD